jgi:hypothetical protein
MNQEEWIAANVEAATRALESASAALYALLGGEVDPEREREALEAEVARLRLTMTKEAGRRPSSTLDGGVVDEHVLVAVRPGDEAIPHCDGEPAPLLPRMLALGHSCQYPQSLLHSTIISENPA